MTVDLQDWVGRTKTAEDVLSLAPARGMMTLLDRDPQALTPGAPLPRAWHWLYFWPLVPQSELAEDGHEARGSFLPPVALPHRMWAGGALEFLRPLRIGDHALRRSTILSVEEKRGRSGPLVFVTVRHEIEGSGQVAVREDQRLVYRAGSGGGPPPLTQRDPAPKGDWRESFLPTPSVLFRFSALTFNAHRIHYDHPYATVREGYPGLVVHGPLLALLLLDCAQRHGVGSPRALTFRSVRPLFGGESVTLGGCSADSGNGLDLWAAAPSGSVAMTARVE